MNDPIEAQLQARLDDVDTVTSHKWYARKYARECAALRRLCAQADERFDFVPPPLRSDPLRAALKAAAEGGEVTQ